jgi:hypothetical protein
MFADLQDLTGFVVTLIFQLDPEYRQGLPFSTTVNSRLTMNYCNCSNSKLVYTYCTVHNIITVYHNLRSAPSLGQHIPGSPFPSTFPIPPTCPTCPKTSLTHQPVTTMRSCGTVRPPSPVTTTLVLKDCASPTTSANSARTRSRTYSH